MKQNQKGFLKQIFEKSEKGKTLLLFSCISSTLGMLCGIIPYLSVYFIGKELLITSNPSSSTIITWIIVAGISILGKMIFSFLGSTGCHYVAFQTLFQFRISVMEHLGKLSMGFFATHTSGSIQKIMDENIEKIEGFIAHMLPDLIGSFAVLTVLILSIAYLNIWLSITVVLSIILAFAFQWLVFGGKKGKQIWADFGKSSQNLTSAFSEFVRGISEVKLFGKMGSIQNSLSDHIKEYLKWETKSYKRSAIPMSMYKSVVLSLLTFALVVGIIIIHGNPTHENLLAVLMTLIMVPSIYDPLMTCVNYGTQMGMLQAGMNQINGILDTQSMKVLNKTKKPKSWDVSFENVSFSYEEESDVLRKMALKDISFTAEQGKMTALVGESGGGKSTIGQLLLRFWDINQGTIRIGGIDIKEISTHNLMNYIASVFQDTYIFADTVFGNISMDGGHRKEEVIEAAKKARCHEFIMKLENGYDTRIGSGGIRLSGGEAQRISIARAILKDAPIIVLDEALAYTDAENENLIQTAIKNLVKNKTVIVIAHRLQSIKDANNTLVLKDGNIFERGSHDKLMKQGQEYRTLWDLQHKVEAWFIENERENEMVGV